jgi:hypothetical protein
MKGWRLAVWLAGVGLVAVPPAWAQKPKWHKRPEAAQRQTREHDFVARVHFNNQQQLNEHAQWAQSQLTQRFGYVAPPPLGQNH